MAFMAGHLVESAPFCAAVCDGLELSGVRTLASGAYLNGPSAASLQWHFRRGDRFRFV
jgi:hypothetical protein